MRNLSKPTDMSDLDFTKVKKCPLCGEIFKRTFYALEVRRPDKDYSVCDDCNDKADDKNRINESFRGLRP
jgi:hypothetical protein